MSIKLVLLSCAAIGFPGLSFAQGVVHSHGDGASSEMFSVGVDYLAMQYQEAGLEDIEPTALRLRGAVTLHPNFELQMMLAAGLSDDSVDFVASGRNIQATLDIDNLFALYAKPQLSIGVVTLYGLVGFAAVELEGTSSYSCSTQPGTCLTIFSEGSEFDFSYGVGAELPFPGDHWSVNLDWIQYVDEQYTLDGVAAGLRYRF